MAKLIIKRSAEFLNSTRVIGIYLDGQKIGVISNGETKIFDINDGVHILKSKIDWCGSRDYQFMVGANETKTVLLSGFKNSKYIIPVFALIIGFHFYLKISQGITTLSYIVIPAFLALSYYYTFGRNDYLRLTEFNDNEGLKGA